MNISRLGLSLALIAGTLAAPTIAQAEQRPQVIKFTAAERATLVRDSAVAKRLPAAVNENEGLVGFPLLMFVGLGALAVSVAVITQSSSPR